jgi:hypothetical protein
MSLGLFEPPVSKKGCNALTPLEVLMPFPCEQRPECPVEEQRALKFRG